MNKGLLSGVASLGLLSLSSAVQAGTLEDTKVTFGGYAKAVAMFSNYSNGAPDSGDLSRQFYVPGTIYGVPGNGKQVVDFHARESRFNFQAVNDIDGHKITGFIELDFMTVPGGNERVSNSYSPRLRQAYISYDNWLAGQTWTTFQNPAALPENLDFVGAADGTPFVRQTQVRYTHGALQFSLENPETTLTPNGGGPRITSGSGVIPDAVARYNFESSGGAKFALAGIARQLKIDQANLDDNTLGYGVSFSGVVPVGKDDFKFTATYGDGLGRYLALNFANGGVVNNSGDIETIKSYAGFAAYRHWWNEQWRSSVTVSGFKADNQLEYTGGAANKEAYSANINLLYSPIKPLTVGVEYMYASNSQESGYDGSLDRILFSAKYML